MAFEDIDSELAFVIVSGIYVLVIGICLCCSGSPRRNVPQEEATPRRLGPEMQETSAASNMETQINCVQTKYQKGVGLVLVGDGTCPVCLDEFEEGEYLRTLPECSHSFHVPCIDMWLYSQPSCPVCRANAKLVTVAVKQ
ncbi:hypothetical protein ACFX13_042032 [Malus domestica]|uniref:E3 ubiquitin-protein ligase Os04g0590900-like n=1 Tax=Malus sylvestris TaxID=3752 RepID=UPI00146058AD|nr:E3 ubiquitin-protein ligase Os04g0590900-like [Malus sylvestris]